MDTQSATITDAERMKLIKWARKNGAARIAIAGIEIEFNVDEPREAGIPSRADSFREEEYSREDMIARMARFDGSRVMRPGPTQAMRDLVAEAPAIGAPIRYNTNDPHTPVPATADSTHKALSAIRSRLEDPEQFAQQSDAWANQTRLPR